MTFKTTNSIAALADDLKINRHALHQNPQIAYEEVFASDMVAEKLAALNIPFVRGLGKTGVVATLIGDQGVGNRSIGLRADMDALPITEVSNQAWASKIPGRMHACGHDGHTTILMGVADYLSKNKNFAGTVHLIFQPAEEGERGANAMMKDGLFEKFPCDEIYALHNWPTLPLGKAGVKSGAFLASSDRFEIVIKGSGGHAAMPHNTTDPIICAAALIQSLQTIISRNIDPTQAGVVSVTKIDAGTAWNIIPEHVVLRGTMRALTPEIRKKIQMRLSTLTEHVALSYGCKAEIKIIEVCDPTINTPVETTHAIKALEKVFGAHNVNVDETPSMGSEDFGAMLQKVPGCYVILGQATPDKNSPHNQGLHAPNYDFNDDLIAPAISFLTTLIQDRFA